MYMDTAPFHYFRLQSRKSKLLRRPAYKPLRQKLPLLKVELSVGLQRRPSVSWRAQSCRKPPESRYIPQKTMRTPAQSGHLRRRHRAMELVLMEEEVVGGEGVVMGGTVAEGRVAEENRTTASKRKGFLPAVTEVVLMIDRHLQVVPVMLVGAEEKEGVKVVGVVGPEDHLRDAFRLEAPLLFELPAETLNTMSRWKRKRRKQGENCCPMEQCVYQEKRQLKAESPKSQLEREEAGSPTCRPK